MLALKLKYKVLLGVFYAFLLTSLSPQNIYILVVFSLMTYILLPIRKWWDNITVMLLLFSIFYSVNVVYSGQMTSGFNLIAYLTAPVAFYRFGKFFISFCDGDNHYQKLFLSIIFCYLISLFILTVKDIAEVGIVNVSRIMLGDSSDSNALAATFYGLMSSIGISCIACLFTQRQVLWLKISYLIVALFSLLVVCHLLNRTGLVIFGCCILSSFIVSSKKNFSRFLSALILIIILSIVVVRSGIINDEILNAYQGREMSSSSDASSLGGRSGIWKDAIQNLFTHPLGWEKVRYAHNLWLDIARVGGWVPFIVFMLVTLEWIKSSIKLIRRDVASYSLILLSINVSIFLASFVEPVIDASMAYFSIMLFFCACTISITTLHLKKYINDN